MESWNPAHHSSCLLGKIPPIHRHQKTSWCNHRMAWNGSWPSKTLLPWLKARQTLDLHASHCELWVPAGFLEKTCLGTKPLVSDWPAGQCLEALWRSHVLVKKGCHGVFDVDVAHLEFRITLFSGSQCSWSRGSAAAHVSSCCKLLMARLLLCHQVQSVFINHQAAGLWS